MKLFNFKSNKGFTLLEILVVISIIGILVALSATAFSVAQKKSRDARRQGDLKQMQTAFEQYYATPENNSSYTNCNAMSTDSFPGGSRPVDPKTNVAYACQGDADEYCACALLESGTGNATDTAGSTTCSFGTPGDYFCVSNLQ
jgi:prepilin-type N-terminal cleavage/methylation domain-containing protein